ncbi:hypothetical protein AAFF_G00229400 [Aldrovandia affinis]|uniref:Uncharacterized protein n=1 Tax=Aldrovandia affinis TaxID=143900 RepID=A0AAD7SVF2_9TELE|nr:hypothetical protein AAFF_G00229400 [Aldrovandia affinis]
MCEDEGDQLERPSQVRRTNRREVRPLLRDTLTSDKSCQTGRGPAKAAAPATRRADTAGEGKDMKGVILSWRKESARYAPGDPRLMSPRL